MSPRYPQQYWRKDQQPRVVFLKGLSKIGIRHRKACNTRHTCGTISMMAGMNPTFVANHLMHSIQVLLSTDARWVHGDKSRLELDRLGQFWDRNRDEHATYLFLAEENGRRGRIRTCDPFLPKEVRYQTAPHAVIGYVRARSLHENRFRPKQQSYHHQSTKAASAPKTHRIIGTDQVAVKQPATLCSTGSASLELEA